MQLYKKNPAEFEKELKSYLKREGGHGHVAIAVDWKDWTNIFSDLPRFDNDPELLKALRTLQKAKQSERTLIGRKSRVAKSMTAVKSLDTTLVWGDRNRLKDKHGESIFRTLADKYGKDVVMGHMQTMSR